MTDIEDIVKQLRGYEQDPMWADHAEVPKMLLTRAIYALKQARIAADSILAPMTMEFGRALIESPESDINIECEGYSVTLKAKQFMALYWATS